MANRIPFFAVDAFTDRPYHGNPAGVFFDDGGVLTTEECGLYSDEVHLESAFVTPAPPGSGADYRLRYFMGTTRKLTSLDPPSLTVSVIEVPLCGHATVAATAALVYAGRVAANAEVRYVTNVGPLPATVRANDKDGVDVTLHQTPQEKGEPLGAEAVAEVAAALGCGPHAIAATGLPVQMVSTGTPWLLVPVGSRAVVDAAPADIAEVTRLARNYGTFGFYAFAREYSKNGEIVFWSRCFAPIAGLDEDPVTGSASGALGWYLADHAAVAALTAQQGFAGGRGGTAHIRVRRENEKNGPVRGVDVTGTALVVAEGMFLKRA